ATWLRVALFAAANPSNTHFASQLVRTVLDQPAPKPQPRRSKKSAAADPARDRHLFALQCRAVAVYLDRDLSERLDGLVADVRPPRTFADAEALAALGDVAVSYLKPRKRMGVKAAVACVRTLRLINTRAARDLLQSYLDEKREQVLVELAQAVNPLTIPA